MTRELLVVIHAGSGVIGLIVGLAVFPPPETNAGRRRVWGLIYAALLVVLLISLVALIVWDWSGLEMGSRLAFSGLAILAAVMLARIYLAHRLAGGDEPGWERRYVSHVSGSASPSSPHSAPPPQVCGSPSPLPQSSQQARC